MVLLHVLRRIKSTVEGMTRPYSASAPNDMTNRSLYVLIAKEHSTVGSLFKYMHRMLHKHIGGRQGRIHDAVALGAQRCGQGGGEGPHKREDQNGEHAAQVLSADDGLGLGLGFGFRG